VGVGYAIKVVFTGRFLGKFAVGLKLLFKNSTILAALPCETLMSKNKRLTINYKVIINIIFIPQVVKIPGVKNYNS